jgi:hypothetical protein
MWQVTKDGNKHLFIYLTGGRETVKRSAFHVLGGDPDLYVLTPLTEEGHIVCANMVLNA